MTTPKPQRWTDQTHDLVYREIGHFLIQEGALGRLGDFASHILGALADAGLLREPHTGPRTWALPEIPADVVKVSDRSGIVWTRQGRRDGSWVSPGTAGWWFGEVLNDFGPLTEVQP